MGRKIAFSTAFKAIFTFNCYQNLKWCLSGLFQCILIKYRSCKDHFSCVGFHLEDHSTCQHLNFRDVFLSSWANDTKGMCFKLILNICRFYKCGLVLWPFFLDMKNIYQSLAFYRYFAPISVYAETYFPASTMGEKAITIRCNSAEFRVLAYQSLQPKSLRRDLIGFWPFHNLSLKILTFFVGIWG